MSRQQFVTFYIGEHLLGIDITMVREINRFLDITAVQRAAPHIRGLMNLRGQLVTVFDLGMRLGFGPREISGSSHNVILKYEPVGLLVDDIGEVVEVDVGEIEKPPANAGPIEGEFLAGVIELPQELLVILAVDKLLAERMGEESNDGLALASEGEKKK